MKYLIILALTVSFSGMTLAQEKIENINSKKCHTLCHTKETCSNLIAENIAMNWSRPPVEQIDSMLAILKISLAQNGAIDNFSIEKSSGNEKFDKSAMQAVKRVGSFCEIQGLNIEDYEKYFKIIYFTFSPQDSRY